MKQFTLKEFGEFYKCRVIPEGHEHEYRFHQNLGIGYGDQRFVEGLQETRALVGEEVLAGLPNPLATRGKPCTVKEMTDFSVFALYFGEKGKPLPGEPHEEDPGKKRFLAILEAVVAFCGCERVPEGREGEYHFVSNLSYPLKDNEKRYLLDVVPFKKGEGRQVLVGLPEPGLWSVDKMVGIGMFGLYWSKE